MRIGKFLEEIASDARVFLKEVNPTNGNRYACLSQSVLERGV